MENENKIRIYDKGVDMPVHTNGSFAEFQCSYHSGDIIIPHIQFAEPLRQECQHFIDCIVNHTEPWSGGRDGWDVVKILEAAQRSLTNGSKQEEIQWEIQNMFVSPPM
jgi:predicted dehydrogenase